MQSTFLCRPMIFAAVLGACAASQPAAAAALPRAAVTAGYDDLAPFSQRLDIVCSAGRGAGTFTVPAGQRLVIDYVSALMTTGANGALAFGVGTVLNGQEVEAHPPLVPQGIVLGEQAFAASAPMKVFADPSSTVTIFALSQTGGCSGIVGVYGHFVPVG